MKKSFGLANYSIHKCPKLGHFSTKARICKICHFFILLMPVGQNRLLQNLCPYLIATVLSVSPWKGNWKLFGHYKQHAQAEICHHKYQCKWQNPNFKANKSDCRFINWPVSHFHSQVKTHQNFFLNPSMKKRMKINWFVRSWILILWPN